MTNNPQSRSLFVVGDDAQSIYGFRGSKIELILGFDKLYPNTKEIILNKNYRSTQPILDLAEKILTHNKSQKQKNLHTDNQNNLQVKYYNAFNEKAEAEFIIKKIISLYARQENSNDISYNQDTETDSNSTLRFESSDDISNDSIGSMFDSFLDATNISKFDIGQKLWGSKQDNSYNPNQWQIPTTDWSQIKELDNVAVLYRTHSQSRAIEETLIKNRVPYRLVSGTRFLDRKEVRDVLAILRYISNGQDRLAFSRFLPLIIDGVGPKTLEKIEVWLTDSDYPLPPKYQSLILEMLSSIQEAWTHHDSIIDLTKELLESLGYNKYLKNEYPTKDEFIARNENISEIYSLMLPFDQNSELDLVSRLREFLSQILLMSNAETKEGDDNLPKVNLLTLHQSKGLEYETVFLVGCEDGLLPHQNSFNEDGGIEEEVRLAYVGVTRAKVNLFLSSAQSRIQFGQIKSNPVSRIFRPFLDTHTKREFIPRY